MVITTATTASEDEWRPLPAGFVVGARVARIGWRAPRMEAFRFGARFGTITRIIDHGGSLAGLVEVHWDGDVQVRRSAGFFSPDELRLLG